MGYQSKQERAEDNHSSAQVLLTTGILGFVSDVIVLIFNPLDMPVFNRYMTTGVMGALFVLFIVMGLLSMRNYYRFHQEARSEDTLRDQIHRWCEENLPAQSVDEAVSVNAAYDEENYFERTTYIKAQIMRQFMNLDENMLDRFVDSYYSEIYDRGE